jgi:hypothetical protein
MSLIAFFFCTFCLIQKLSGNITAEQAIISFPGQYPSIQPLPAASFIILYYLVTTRITGNHCSTSGHPPMCPRPDPDPSHKTSAGQSALDVEPPE